MNARGSQLGGMFLIKCQKLRCILKNFVKTGCPQDTLKSPLLSKVLSEIDESPRVSMVTVVLIKIPALLCTGVAH